MEYWKTGRGALFCAILAILTLSVQSEAGWKKLFKPKFVKTTIQTAKNTAFIQRILQKLGVAPVISNKPVPVISNKPVIYVKDMNKKEFSQQLKKFGRIDSRRKLIKNMDPEKLTQELKCLGYCRSRALIHAIEYAKQSTRNLPYWHWLRPPYKLRPWPRTFQKQEEKGPFMKHYYCEDEL